MNSKEMSARHAQFKEYVENLERTQGHSKKTEDGRALLRKQSVDIEIARAAEHVLVESVAAFGEV